MLIILWMTFALMFALIGIGVFLWKKNENLSMKEIYKKIWWKIVSSIIIIGTIYVYINYIPLNKNHGIEFNPEREKLGIPKIGEKWKNRKYLSDQYATCWQNVETKNGHIEKIIEYGILDAKSETDYYKNFSKGVTLAWSKYNFKNKTFEYFIKKSNNENISTRDSGKQKLEKSSIIKKIDKSEFEKYIKK